MIVRITISKQLIQEKQQQSLRKITKQKNAIDPEEIAEILAKLIIGR